MKDYKILEKHKRTVLLTGKSSYWLQVQSEVNGKVRLMRITKQEYGNE